MDGLINVTKKDPKVQIKIKVISDKNIRLPYDSQPKTVYDTLIQNVNLQGLLNLMGATIVDIDIEFKMKNRRIKYLENRVFFYIK